MITALFTLVLAFQTSSTAISRIPVDPANPPANDHPTCSWREDPPRLMPDDYLDLVVSPVPFSDPALDPNSGQNVDVFAIQPFSIRSMMPFPWTSLIIECQATDDQWAQIIAGMSRLTAPLVIAQADTGTDCPTDGSGMYYDATAYDVYDKGDGWQAWRGGFVCVPPGGPMVDTPQWQPTDISKNIPQPTPDTVPLSVCIFDAGQSAGSPIYRGADGTFWVMPWARYWNYDDPNAPPVLYNEIECDDSLGYALMMPDYLVSFDLVNLMPFSMGDMDTAACLSPDGSDWFFNTATLKLKQCAQMLADDLQAAADAAYWAANPLPTNHGPQDPIDDPLELLCNGLPCGTVNDDPPQ